MDGSEPDGERGSGDVNGASALAQDLRRSGGLPGPGPRRILIVDDEEPILQLLASVLVRFGYQVLCATTPEQALHLGGDPELDIDLLLTDVAMPRMNGVELYANLIGLRPGLPVLYLSGYIAEAARQWGVPATDLLEKPFSLAELTQRVGAILDR